MHKFKVGDRVRRINSNLDTHSKMTIGSEWIVRHISGDTWMYVEGYSNGLVLIENFELVKAQSPIREVTRREIIPGKPYFT